MYLAKSLLTGQHLARISLTIDLSTKKLKSTTFWRTPWRAGPALSVGLSGRRSMGAITCLAAIVEPTSAGDVVESIAAPATVEE